MLYAGIPDMEIRFHKALRTHYAKERSADIHHNGGTREGPVQHRTNGHRNTSCPGELVITISSEMAAGRSRRLAQVTTRSSRSPGGDSYK